MNVVYQNDSGKIIHSDNLEAMKEMQDCTVDSCISDFPYNLSFMGRKWDTTNNFYDWCKLRAEGLYRIIKHGGYVCIFGHPKTNHRMKSAFEDVGFNIVEEIDWVYLTGMPKSQDIGKLFDKKAGVKREVIGYSDRNDRKLPSGEGGTHGTLHDEYKEQGREPVNLAITTPATDQAKIWDGWKTAGLKPAHEPITIFQKPLEGTYIQNIDKFGCGGMNIDACRVSISQADINMINAKSSKNPTTNYSDREDRVYGKYAEDKAMPANTEGRFPPNMILDEYIAEEFDEQTGDRKGGTSNGNAEVNIAGNGVTPLRRGTLVSRNDNGGGSRMFPIIKYNTKVSPKERLLPNGERNPHVTLKPIELIKWLIKLVTPINGTTIDITAGSCTHAVACEELNGNEGYNLKWVNVEMMNTEREPYCEVGKIRVENVAR